MKIIDRGGQYDGHTRYWGVKTIWMYSTWLEVCVRSGGMGVLYRQGLETRALHSTPSDYLGSRAEIDE
jgi:hypothetical protein